MTDKFRREIYLLRPGELTPEMIAVTFAKTSRSPLSFREIAAELTEEKSSEFHEKWVVGYGHGSVAEHAVLHIAFENVSRLAVECIESNRLASYTEKSTRYQKWEPGGYFQPPELQGRREERVYRELCDRLFETYLNSLDPLRQVVQGIHYRRDGESDDAWDQRVRSKYVDAARFLLPAASLANLGMTANARALEHAIRKMLSHPLQEVREIGEAVREVAQLEAPTLVKYSEPMPYSTTASQSFRSQTQDWPIERGRAGIDLVQYDPEAEDTVLAAALYSQAGCSFQQVMRMVSAMGDAEKNQLAEDLLATMGRHDVPLRVLEHAVYTFDVCLDQGAYFELKRHRIMTQTAQPLQAGLGYATPRLFWEAGLEERYREAMDAAGSAYQTIAEWNPQVAAYIVPNGYNRRVLITLNLREVFHLCELRSRSNAHFSIRRMALQIAERIQQVHPRLTRYLRMPPDVSWQDTESEHFIEV